MTWREKMRLVPTLKNISQLNVSSTGVVTAMGRTCGPSDIYKVRRLPRTGHLMVILTAEQYGDVIEWSARSAGSWYKGRLK